MLNNEIVAYVRNLLNQGISRDVIEKNLLSTGWTHEDVTQAFNALTPPASPSPQPAAPTTPAVSQANIAPIQSLVQPIQTPTQPFQAPILHLAQKKKFHIPSSLIIGSLVILILLATAAYAYVEKIGPFSLKSAYTESNLFSGILEHSANIKTSAYAVSGSLEVVPREGDAEPFTVKVENTEKIKKYENDIQRAKDAQAIMNAVMYSSQKEVYPTTLASLKGQKGIYYSNFSTTDPATSKDYNYSVTENGKNFALKITFETDEAISQLQKLNKYYADKDPKNKIIVDGRTVTFNKNTGYTYLSSELPKPFFVALGELAKYLPNEFKADLTLSAKTDWQPDALPDWIFNVDANGDFGDLQYKFNVDALKKDKDYYFKINNIPSIFLGSFSNAKGEWVKVTKDENDKNDGYNVLSGVADSLENSEKSYKENRADAVTLLKKAAQFADEEKLMSFKSAPRQEKIGNRTLYRYELQVNKNAILPFYQKLVAEARNIDNNKIFFEDNGMVDYLQSEEFNDVFDYYQKNIKTTLWTDEEGYPARLEYLIRMVPADSAEQLKDKQANLILTLEISDINKPVIIEAPKESKSIEEIGGGVFSEARDKGSNAFIKADLANLRAAAELYYDAHSSYGKSSMSGSCVATGTMFAEDQYFKKNIPEIKEKQTKETSPSLVCYSDSKTWAMSASLIETDSEKGYWCIDSTGFSKQTTKLLNSTSCK
jgi:hypothetical protein